MRRPERFKAEHGANIDAFVLISVVLFDAGDLSVKVLSHLCVPSGFIHVQRILCDQRIPPLDTLNRCTSSV